jgi:hypothetical protein
MRLESRSFYVAKDVDTPQFYEDAFHVDERKRMAAIADGVASAIFSGLWARVLTQAVVAEPPNLEDQAAFQSWLADRRTEWREQIDLSKIPLWRLGDKMALGGMSTLLWVLAAPADGEPDLEPGAHRFQSFAIGDCCLFHVRQGQTIRSFPMTASADFDLSPGMIGSVDRKQDHLLAFSAIEDYLLPGDTLVLCTDALACWSLAQSEAGSPVDWESYWTMTDEDWQNEIAAIRAARQIRFDDTTLLLLRLADELNEEAIETPFILENPEEIPIALEFNAEETQENEKR